MAGEQDAQWLDLLEEDIPVVDSSGKQLLVKGLDFVDPNKAPASSAPAAPAAATPAQEAVPAQAGQQPAAAPPPAPAPATGIPAGPTEDVLKPVTKEDLAFGMEKDVAEVKKAEAEVPKKIVTEEVTAVTSLLDGMVDEAVSISGVPFADEDMKRRFRTLVSLYFRDLRDQLETKSKFTMPAQSGGMGMNDADADRVIAMLRLKNDEFHSAMAGRAAEGKAKFVQEQAEKQLAAAESEEKREEERREEVYSGLMKKTGMQPGASAAPTPPPAPKGPATPPKVVPVVGVQGGAPAAASASAPAQPAPGQSRPVVADVKFVQKLTGPVDELRAMTVKDFRRLSKDPREATLKIKDKIDLLEDQSFEMKTHGVKAWQESEVNKLYLDILRQSLEGKPVIDVIADRDAKGDPSLSKAEFDSIMELNRKLRFG